MPLYLVEMEVLRQQVVPTATLVPLARSAHLQNLHTTNFVQMVHTLLSRMPRAVQSAQLVQSVLTQL